MKLFRVLALLISTLILTFSISLASSIYPPYLNGDTNLKLIDGHMGTGYYYDSTSVVNMLYNPPYYQIAVNVAVVPDAHKGNTAISRVIPLRFYYNIDKPEILLLNNNTGYPITYLHPDQPLSISRVRLPAAEKAFYQIYNLRFFDSFSNEFYWR